MILLIFQNIGIEHSLLLLLCRHRARGCKSPILRELISPCTKFSKMFIHRKNKNQITFKLLKGLPNRKLGCTCWLLPATVAFALPSSSGANVFTTFRKQSKIVVTVKSERWNRERDLSLKSLRLFFKSTYRLNYKPCHKYSSDTLLCIKAFPQGQLWDRDNTHD